MNVSIYGGNRDTIDLSGTHGTALINRTSACDVFVRFGDGISTAYGGPGDTIYAGTSSAGTIFADSGDISVVLGSTGSDTVYSGSGNTITVASQGTADAVIYGAANDLIDIDRGRARFTSSRPRETKRSDWVAGLL